MVIFILSSIKYTIYSVKHIKPTPDCKGELLATRCRKAMEGYSPEPWKAGKAYKAERNVVTGTVKRCHAVQEMNKKKLNRKFNPFSLKMNVLYSYFFILQINNSYSADSLSSWELAMRSMPTT